MAITSDYGEQVIAKENLNLRAEGSGHARIIGSVRRDAIVHVDGPINQAGYFPCHIVGWMPKDRRVLLTDPLLGDLATLDLVLYPGAKFEPVNGEYEAGLVQGVVRGWVSRLWVKPVEPRKELVR